MEAESIFKKNCDSDGLMTKASLKELQFVMELLEDGDLLEDELNQLWTTAPKFPGDGAKIGVDSFVQIYRDIDDLFEESEGEDGKPEDDDTDDEELTTIFKSISTGGVLSKEALTKWTEVQSLMKEGLLDNDEFSGIWDRMPKAEDGQLDLNGFVKFNGALDDLFDFEDLEDEEEEFVVKASPPKSEAKTTQPEDIIDGVDLSAATLFEALMDSDGLVGMAELKRWGELQEMLKEGELMPLEFESFFDAIVKSDKDKLNRNGFMALYNKIDSLFEDDDDDDDQSTSNERTTSETKEQLFATVDSLNADKERLPCGLESTESEKRYVQELAATLEAERTNSVRQKQGAIEMADLIGQWELLYSSSSAMSYNKGLSGLGGSFPNGSFGGLKMKLQASKFLSDVEYKERINVVPDSASFDVTVNGSWELRSSVSIFTGEPAIALTVVPFMVTYGPTETRADHWKSLGPTNMLDLSYLDDDLRIMRGNTNTDSILIFKRTK